MQIDYSIQYSNRKTLTIIVERDRSIVVRAPLNTRKEVIETEVDKRKYLLFKKINHPQKYEKPKPRKEFVSGESLLYLGQHYKLEITQEHFEGVGFDDSKFCISRLSQNNAQQLFKEWYFMRATEKIVPKVNFYARNLGVRYNSVKLMDLKYRWGSCTPKDNINFNWRLIKAPIFVIDYIIVHELTHLLESNHTERFWNIVSVQLPHYNKAKDWLKENGHFLETEF